MFKYTLKILSHFDYKVLNTIYVNLQKHTAAIITSRYFLAH